MQTFITIAVGLLVIGVPAVTITLGILGLIKATVDLFTWIFTGRLPD